MNPTSDKPGGESEGFRVSDEGYRLLFENANDAILIADVETGLILDVNQQACVLLGRPRQKIVGLHQSQLHPPEEAKQYAKKYRELLENGRTITEDAVVCRADGVIVPVNISASVTEHGGRRIIQGIFRDLSGFRRVGERMAMLNRLKEQLLGEGSLSEKLKLVTDGTIDILGADFARVWMTDTADLCDNGCPHAAVTEGPHVCRDRTMCLHLMASSGRYTRLDGSHRRVPMGCYKIGRVASGDDPMFITNDVVHDVRVHNHEWAASLGLVSFAGYKLRSADGKPVGVLALFSQKAITADEEALLQDIANTTSHVILAEKAKKALKESEVKYRSLFENSGSACMIVEEDKTISLVNREFEKVSGYSREEIEGKMKWTQFISSQDDLKRMTEYHRLRRINPSLAPQSYELHFANRRGEEMVMVITVAMIPGTRKSLAAYVDITHLKKVEADLQDSEEKLRAIVHGSPIPQFVINREHKVVQWNKPLEEISSIREDEVLGTDLHWRAFYKETRPCLCDLLVDGKESAIPVWYGGKSAKSKSAPDAYEATDYIPLLGRWMHFMAATIRDSKGNIIGAVETLEDITNRKRYEEALLEAQKHLQAIIDTSPDMIFIHDLDGHIIDVNEMVLKNTGYAREELEGACASDLSGKDAVQDSVVERIELAAKGVPQDFEWVCRKKDGSEFPVEVRVRGFGSTLEDGKRVPRALAIVRDISERKRAEEERARLEGQLLHAQKMESIGRLAGGIAHDFNNLLTPILGYSDMLLSDFTPPDPRHESIQHIREAADRAKDLTRQLLSFGRRQAMALKPLDLGDVVKRFEPMLRRTIREDVRIDVDIASDLSKVRADIGQIEQILMNLAVNAQDAMPAGGVLTVGLENVSLDEVSAVQLPHLRPGNYVMLTVSDTGIGMSNETKGHLFDPFFTTKEVGRGTGLGLSTVYGIVKQHGGSISVYSELGKGSVFKVYFPRIAGAAAAAGEVPAPHEQSGVGGEETILVVEDNAMVRDLACVMLRRLGYQVIAADSGDSAFEIAEKYSGTIHLLVTDIVLPKIAGQAILKRLSARRPALKVLYMSGFASSNVTHDGVLEEGTNFIQKPLTYSALSKAVRHVLDSP